MSEQLAFDFSGPKPDVTRPVDSLAHLRQLVEDGEHMIYLYGENPHACFIRTHSSSDDGTLYPVMRKEAVSIMGRHYVHHCNHVSHDKSRARVYLKRKGGRKK